MVTLLRPFCGRWCSTENPARLSGTGQWNWKRLKICPKCTLWHNKRATFRLQSLELWDGVLYSVKISSPRIFSFLVRDSHQENRSHRVAITFHFGKFLVAIWPWFESYWCAWPITAAGSQSESWTVKPKLDGQRLLGRRPARHLGAIAIARHSIEMASQAKNCKHRSKTNWQAK